MANQAYKASNLSPFYLNLTKDLCQRKCLNCLSLNALMEMYEKVILNDLHCET